ncbi:hypothetical protein ACFQNF_15085 [Iodobacter arcticus]|uniref:Uncharacterized protein n=1 Tax=Iodobacter arcticus TaxID=590593 RepID=A0ABW2R545_9NEIS
MRKPLLSIFGWAILRFEVAQAAAHLGLNVGDAIAVFRGVKMHPTRQDQWLEEQRARSILQALAGVDAQHRAGYLEV